MEDSSKDDQISQASYEGSPYEDASWEIIGHMSEKFEFTPLEMDAISHDLVNVDPMFADYGGLAEEASMRRWHLPEHMTIEQLRGDSNAEDVAAELARTREAELQQAKNEAFERGKAEGFEE